jgi:hypothetical protein
MPLVAAPQRAQTRLRRRRKGRDLGILQEGCQQDDVQEEGETYEILSFLAYFGLVFCIILEDAQAHATLSKVHTSKTIGSLSHFLSLYLLISRYMVY